MISNLQKIIPFWIIILEDHFGSFTVEETFYSQSFPYSFHLLSF